MITTLLFYLFSFMVVVSAIAVISSKNPIYSVLFLIFAFFNSAGLFILLGAEFLAMLLVIVYVGAVAVLFLFVVMMLNINLAKIRQGFLKYLPVGIFMAFLMLGELYLVLNSSPIESTKKLYLERIVSTSDQDKNITNTEELGNVLYTDFVYLFQLSGLILLVAMIGAIVLTLRHRDSAKRQNISTQLARDSKDAIRIVKVNTGDGI